MIKLSIITINFNNAIGLQKTIESVISQMYQEYEFIIIDGDSQDSSKHVLQTFDDRITWWVSEPDNGIYDAMNKGIQQSKGDYLLFLNSGDYLYDGEVLEKIFTQKCEADVIYGDIDWEENGVRSRRAFPDTLSFGYFVWDALPHQASFIKRKVFDEMGLYSENYGISGDWAFFTLAICKYNCSYQHVSAPVAVCNRDGISCQPESWNDIVQNKQKLMKKEFPLIYTEYKALQSNADELKGLRASRWVTLFSFLGLIKK